MKLEKMMAIQGKKILNRPVEGENGSSSVELAFSLVFLFIFLMVFFQMVGIFIAHERTSYSAYVGARVNSVHGNVARSVLATKSRHFYAVGEMVTVYEYKQLPMNMSEIFRHGGERLRVSTNFTIPIEGGTSGDN